MNRYLFLARGVEPFMLFADNKRAALAYGLEMVSPNVRDARAVRVA